MSFLVNKEFFYRVKIGDTISEIKRQFNSDNIVRNNKDIPLFAGEWLLVKVNDYKTHIVKPAETLNQIADQNNITVEKLIEDNNLSNEKIFIGQRLKIIDNSNKKTP